MRQLHVIRDLDPGCVTTQLRLLATVAASTGRSVTVATLSRPPQTIAQRLAAAGVELRWVGKRFAVDPFAAAGLWRLGRRRRATLWQSWDEESAALCSRAVLRSGAAWAHRLRSAEEVVPSLASADAVLATDPEAIAAAASIGVRGDRIHQVPNAIDPTLKPTPEDQKPAARRRLRQLGHDVSDAAPVIALVVGFDRLDTARELVWAADLVRAVQPGLRLLVVGDGRTRDAVQRFAAGATEPGLVVFLGAADDRRTAIEAADIVWCAEAGAASTTMLEATAVGRPVVCTDQPGRERLVSDPTSKMASDGEPVLTACRLALLDRPGWARATDRLLGAPHAAAERVAHAASRLESHSLLAVAAAAEPAWRAATRGVASPAIS